MMRTTQPIAVFGSRQAIVTLESTVFTGFSPSGASRRLPRRLAHPEQRDQAADDHQAEREPERVVGARSAGR